ncbi:hypothetical protein SLEP1_g20997 [Rubroshorea leprosula]|uniref:Uncharacterized protein n=1 Tax=Rubroshorea leprosula TaxID=152421 RepID=A0AAV5JGH5_9ROSI|nr:hypothetical protein SLEP1_g20991 [Rubroshorea leprosula]GKV09510.1 hypothetical protein SLEP1_g20997 [Rubroshorea leprosula]
MISSPSSTSASSLGETPSLEGTTPLIASTAHMNAY